MPLTAPTFATSVHKRNDRRPYDDNDNDDFAKGRKRFPASTTDTALAPRHTPGGIAQPRRRLESAHAHAFLLRTTVQALVSDTEFPCTAKLFGSALDPATDVSDVFLSPLSNYGLHVCQTSGLTRFRSPWFQRSNKQLITLESYALGNVLLTSQRICTAIFSLQFSPCRSIYRFLFN